MSSNIPQVQDTPLIRDAEFVKLTVTFTNGTTRIVRNFFFSTAYKPETINGEVYNELGGLLNISTHQRDITSSGADTSVVLTGLDPLYIYIVAGAPASSPIPVTGQDPIPVGYYPLIKGSSLIILRGFYDANYGITNAVLRYTGIITSYAIQEERDNSFDALNDTYTIALNCSAYRQLLENKLSGRRTNQQSWNYWFPNDTSMNRVAGLESKQFDFGKPVEGGSKQNTSANDNIMNRGVQQDQP